MTDERTRLLAELEALRRADELAPGTTSIPYAIAEREAELAKLDAEPDWAPAVERYCEAADVPHACREAVKRGLIASAPLFPRDAGMTDAEIYELADKWLMKAYDEGSDLRSSLDGAIRETLKRAPRPQSNNPARIGEIGWNRPENW
jgi:hypothetical protein